MLAKYQINDTNSWWLDDYRCSDLRTLEVEFMECVNTKGDYCVFFLQPMSFCFDMSEVIIGISWKMHWQMLKLQLS